MPASRMCQGVSKSGSPTPSEMASFILATMSKKSRMPDLGRLTTCLAMKRDWSMNQKLFPADFADGRRYGKSKFIELISVAENPCKSTLKPLKLQEAAT